MNALLRLGDYQILQRRNVLDVSHLHGSPFPCLEDLANALLSEPVPDSDAFTAPSQYEVELNQLPLQIGPVVAVESRHWSRETDQVGAQRLAELIEPKTVQLDLVKRPKRSTPAAQWNAATWSTDY